MGSIRRFGKASTQIRVKLGESFVLELPAAATGGYTWQVASRPRVVVLREQRFLPASPARGGPSLQELEFSSVRSGEEALVLEYKRPWDTTVAERLEVGIVVEPGSSGS